MLSSLEKENIKEYIIIIAVVVVAHLKQDTIAVTASTSGALEFRHVTRLAASAEASDMMTRGLIAVTALLSTVWAVETRFTSCPTQPL